MTTASRAPAKILPLHAVHAEDDTISLRTLPTAITSTLKLAIKLPKQLLSPRFSAFEPRQAIPDLPRSLLIRLKVLLFLYPAFFLFGFDGRFRSMRKSIYADMQEHLEKNALRTSEPDPILEVEHQDLPSHLENFYDHPVPFVVRNYNPDSPAVKKWSLDWLSENYGDFLCSSSDAADHTPRKLSSLLAKDYYINFLDRIFRVHPELEDELEAEEITKQFSEILGIEHTYKEFFASQKSGSGSGLHSHSVWNFFLQVSGKKEWTLIDPEFSHLVYCLNNTMEFGTQIGLGEDLPDFPLYEFCPKYRVTLNPGDLLFNPPMWWHQVENKVSENDAKKISIGVTFKYYNSARDSDTTFSDPRFNLFNEIHCLWRGLFIFRYAEFLSRPRTKYTAEADATECPVQARIWANHPDQGESASRWSQFRYICLNDPEANEY